MVYIGCVFRFLTNPLDRWVIRMATRSVHNGDGGHQATAAEAYLKQPDFFTAPIATPADFDFSNEQDFHFRSPVSTPWPENDTVHGKLYRAGDSWKEKPAVILLHGWNGELGYRHGFPFLARRLARLGVNVAMLELPYHGQRKPSTAGAIRNFISHDLLRMVEATRQAMSDVRALMAWLETQGSRGVGLWGISMGAWLSGLLVSQEARTKFAVLMSPVARMDQAVMDLAFCEPIRRSLQGTGLSLEPLNLASHRPLAAPEDILIVESKYDLFAPAESIEEVWRAWNKPEIWRLRHGHISVLGSPWVMEKTIRWVARKAVALEGKQKISVATKLASGF